MRGREPLAIVLAIVIHAALAVALFSLRRTTDGRQRTDAPPEDVAIELVDVPSPPPLEDSIALTGEVTSASVSDGTARSSAISSILGTHAEQPPEIAPLPSTEPAAGGGAERSRDLAPAPSSSDAVIVMLAPGALGIAGATGSNPLLAGRGAAPDALGSGSIVRPGADRGPSTMPNDKAAESAVREALRADDATRGLGAEGPVVTALRDATYASAAPVTGTATFLAVIDASGLVVDLKLLGSTGGDGWSDAHARAKRALAGAKIALRGARGAELAIRVESDVRRPSGTSASDSPVRQAVRPGAVTMSESSSGGTWATQVAADGDVSDLANAKRRVVSLRVVSRKSL